MRYSIIYCCVFYTLGCGGGETLPSKGELGDTGFDGIIVDFSGLEGDMEELILETGEYAKKETHDDFGIEQDIEKPNCETFPKDFGCECVTPDDCISGLCIDVEYGKICSVTCTDKCPDGFSCLQVSGQRDVMFICLPKFSKLCQPCKAHLDCQAKGAQAVSVCVDYGEEGSFCGVVCNSEIDCPNNYICKDMSLADGTPTKQCVKKDMKCQCNSLGKALGMATYCVVTNDIGQCKGERQCLADGLSVCNAPTPSKEECDQKDNDCNGITDDLPADASCQIENEYGKCIGKKSCVGGKEVCVGDVPKPEICDGLDNNCNGFVDEGYEDTDKDGKSDCVDPDDDNDGVADEKDNCPLVLNPDQSDIDGDTKGDLCDFDMDGDGFLNDIDCAPKEKDTYPGAPEICDGKDNNCNDKIDEGICDDGIACTFDFCDSQKGLCDTAPDDSKCEDNNPCTQDKCEKGKGCVYIPITGPECDDQNSCTINDTCKEGKCVGDPAPGCCVTNKDCDDKNPCTIDVCDVQGGKCKYEAVVDGTSCDADNDGCTVGDKCSGGNCIPGAQADCSEYSDICNKGKCKSLAADLYVCEKVPLPKGASCDDGEFCTANDFCDGEGACVGGEPRDCAKEVGDQCNGGYCDELAKTCVKTKKPDYTQCDDGNSCTLTDYCVNGICVGEGSACVEERINVAGPGTKRPQMGSLGYGRYVTQWTGSGQGDNYMRLSDGNGSRENEEVKLCGDKGSQWSTKIAVQETGNFVVLKWEGASSATNASFTGELWAVRYNHNGIEKDKKLLRKFSGSAGYNSTVSIGALKAIPISFSDNTFAELDSIKWSTSGNDIKSKNPPALEIRFAPMASDLSPGTTLVIVPSAKMGGADMWDASLIPNGSDTFLLTWIDSSKTKLWVKRFQKNGLEDTPQDILVYESKNDIYQTRVIGFKDSKFLVVFDIINLDGSGRGVYAQRFYSDGTKMGNLFKVNQQTNGDQRLGDVASFSDNGFVIVYDDQKGDTNGYAVKARLYDDQGEPVGNEITINDIAPDDQFIPSVVALPSDEWVVSFIDSKKNVWTRRYFKDGTPSMGKVEMRANTTTKGGQTNPKASISSNNNIMVVWESPIFGKEVSEVVGRIFDPTGKEVKEEFQINTYYKDSQSSPSVAGGPDRFVVVWESMAQDGSGDGVFGQLFYGDGKTLGNEFQINKSIQDFQRQPSVAMASSGHFLVAWNGYSQTPGSISDIFAKTYDKDGEQVADEFIVNSTLAKSQEKPFVVSAPNKTEFIIAWESKDQDGSGLGVYMRKFNVSGQALSNEVQINATTGGDQRNVSLSISPDTKRILACWESFGQDLINTWGVICQFFNYNDLTLAGTEFIPHALTKGAQLTPAIAYLNNGEVLVAWSSEGVDYEGFAVQVLKYNDMGQAMGPRIVANRFWNSNQHKPFIVPLQNLSYFIGWQSENQDGDGPGIYFRILPSQ